MYFELETSEPIDVRSCCVVVNAQCKYTDSRDVEWCPISVDRARFTAGVPGYVERCTHCGVQRRVECYACCAIPGGRRTHSLTSNRWGRGGHGRRR
jgi:hypothetical protein